VSDQHSRREMGVSHADFFRILPKAMAGTPYEVDGLTVRGSVDQGEVVITVGAEQVRRIALLAIPYCEVSFDYRNLTQAQIDTFDATFYLSFQRGGG